MLGCCVSQPFSSKFAFRGFWVECHSQQEIFSPIKGIINWAFLGGGGIPLDSHHFRVSLLMKVEFYPGFMINVFFHIFWSGLALFGAWKKECKWKKRISSVIWYWIISQFVFGKLPWPCFDSIAMQWHGPVPGPSPPAHRIQWSISSDQVPAFFLEPTYFLQQQRGTLDMTSWNSDWFFFGILLLMADERFQNQKTGKYHIPPIYSTISRVNWSRLTWIGRITAFISRFWQGKLAIRKPSILRGDRGDT